MPELPPDLPWLALGILVVGTPVLVPSIHLAVTGEVGLGTVLLALVLATQVSDAIWYAVGRSLPLERLEALRPLRRRRARLRRLAAGIGPGALFAARFLYGTKIAANVACGARRLPLAVFSAVNLASAMLWFGLLALLVVAAGPGVEAVAGQAHATKVGFTLFALLGVGVSLLSRRIAARRLALEGER